MDVAWASFCEGAAARNLVFLSGKVAEADDEGYLVCAAGAGWMVLPFFGFFCVFCNDWCVVCTQFYAVVESLVAGRCGMAA